MLDAFNRAALKSDRACDQTDNVSATTAHFGQERGTGAIPGAGLATHPSPCFSLDSASEYAQHGGRDGMTDATPVFARADIQRVMSAILDAPVLARQFQEAGRIGLRRGQTGDDPDRLDFLSSVFEFANPVNSRHLRDVGKAHLSGRDLASFNAAPFDPTVALIHRLVLRGKKLPEGSGALDFGGFPGCP